MEIRQLQYFVRVAEMGSFTRAAAILHVAQPALSRQIRQLEDSLQTRLLTRNGRGVIPTEEGLLLLSHSRGILRQIARAREEIEGMRGRITGRVAVGMPLSISTSLALPLARRLREALPNVELAITNGRSAVLQEGLASGRIDFAVLYDAPFSPHFEKMPLARQSLVLVQKATSPIAAPLTLEEVSSVPLVIQSQPNTVRMLLEAELNKQGLKPRIAMEIDNLKTILELVRHGYGSAVVTRRAAQQVHDAQDFHVRPIFRPELAINLSLAVPLRPLPRAHKAVIEIIREETKTVYHTSIAVEAETA